MAAQTKKTPAKEAAASKKVVIPSIRIPRSRVAADRLVSETAERERTIRALENKRDEDLQPHEDAIVKINKQFEEDVAALLPAVERGMRTLWRWYLRNIDPTTKSRVIPLPSGPLGMKLDSNWKIEIDDDSNEAAVIKAVRRVRKDFVKTTVTVSLDRDAVIAGRDRLKRIKGLRIFRSDRIYADPIALRDMTKPKHDRLRVPVAKQTE